MSKAVDFCKEVLPPLLDSIAVELVDVEFVPARAGQNPTLWVYIYHNDGVDLELLEKVHKLVDPFLDEKEFPYEGTYTLNISSPGLDRPFKVDSDFKRAVNKEVEVRFYAPIEKGKKLFVGTLMSFDNDSVTILVEGEEKRFLRSLVAKVGYKI